MTLTAGAIRNDLKCGQGAISPGEKCTKGRTSAAQLGYKQSHYGLKEEAFGRINGKVLSNRQVRQVERGIVAREMRTGRRENLNATQAAALISTRGTASRRYALGLMRNTSSATLKTQIKNSEGSNDPMTFAIRRTAKRELFNRRAKAGIGALGAGLAAGALVLAARRRDSVWAHGFDPHTPELDL